MTETRSRLLVAYRVAATLARPLARPLIAWRVRRGKEDPARVEERYGIASRARPPGPLLWVHASSVGETVSILPLAQRIVTESGVSGLLTTGTVTSARIAETRLGDGLAHQFAPLDGPSFVRRFLDYWRPDLAIFAESELWPNMIMETAARGIGIALVNGRMSERSFSRWRRRGAGVAGHLLARFDVCLAQSEADAERLRALGADHVRPTGNLKFDVPPPPAPEAELSALSSAVGERPRWMAASTHPGEDDIVLTAHALLAAERPGLITVVAPRHPERGGEIAARAEAAGLRTARRSTERQPAPDTDVFIMDSIGEMGLVFRLVPAVFMGGSLVPHGGQNPIEPARLGAAIAHGPHVANFDDIYRALDRGGGAAEIYDAVGLSAVVGKWLDVPATAKAQADAAIAILAPLSGALERTMAELAPLLARLTRQG